MSFINSQEKEIHCKIAYHGPTGAGKSTSLRFLYEKTAAGHKGKLVSLSEEKDHALFFDFLPLSLGKVKDYTLRIHLYSIPEHVVHNSSRNIILKGTDGIIFVVDSRMERLEENLESWRSLKPSLKLHDINLETIPLAFQYNKRDFPNVMPVDELRRALNPRGLPDFETVAKKGTNVLECFQVIAKKVLQELEKE